MITHMNKDLEEKTLDFEEFYSSLNKNVEKIIKIQSSL